MKVRTSVAAADFQKVGDRLSLRGDTTESSAAYAWDASHNQSDRCTNNNHRCGKFRAIRLTACVLTRPR